MPASARTLESASLTASSGLNRSSGGISPVWSYTVAFSTSLVLVCVSRICSIQYRWKNIQCAEVGFVSLSWLSVILFARIMRTRESYQVPDRVHMCFGSTSSVYLAPMLVLHLSTRNQGIAAHPVSPSLHYILLPFAKGNLVHPPANTVLIL